MEDPSLIEQLEAADKERDAATKALSDYMDAQDLDIKIAAQLSQRADDATFVVARLRKELAKTRINRPSN